MILPDTWSHRADRLGAARCPLQGPFGPRASRRIPPVLTLAPWAALVFILEMASPAQALPGLDVDADLFGGLRTAGPQALAGGNVDMDLYAGTPVFKASVHAFGLGERDGVVEGVLRWELDAPFLTIRPGIGYQANTLFSTLSGGSLSPGTLDSAPYGNVWVTLSPPVVPLTFDAAVGASYPIGLRSTVVD